MAIIKNYGLRWSRERIEWGGRGKGNSGALRGKYATAASKQIVDFREQIGIYVLYDKDLQTVYVGQAGQGNARLLDRLKTHTNDHLRDRWSYFSWFGFRDVNKSGKLSEKQAPESEIKTPYTDALNEIEGILIEALEPRLNKQGARWAASEYVQHFENDEDKISKIYEMIESLTQKPRPSRS